MSTTTADSINALLSSIQGAVAISSPAGGSSTASPGSFSLVSAGTTGTSVGGGVAFASVSYQ
jgi:hypothetical protein